MAAPDDGKRDGGGKGEEAQLSERLRQLDAKLGQRRAERQRAERGPQSGGMQGLGLALRVSSEFAAGIIVGAGLGWVLDYWAGTSPWGLIILLLLGFAAGVLNVLRSLGKVAGPETRMGPGDGLDGKPGGDAGS